MWRFQVRQNISTECFSGNKIKILGRRRLLLIAKSVRVYRRNGRNPRFLSLPSSLPSQITDYSLIIYIGSKNSKLRNTGEVELVEHDEGIDVKERVYFCEILVSTMTQDTSPRTEGSGDENTDLSSSRRTRRNTSRRDQRIPNLFGLTARISGFLEISLSLSLRKRGRRR